MSEKKYEIIIKNVSAGSQAKKQTLQTNEDGTSLFSAVLNGAKNSGVLALGKQVITFATSRVGIETGDRQLQDNINAWETFVTKSISIGGAFLMNPALGLAAVASETFSLMSRSHTFNYERNMENIALKQVRDRGGISLNRSRREFQ